MSSAIKSRSPTIRRIMREAQEMANAPSPDYTAAPLESDLFEWHFTLRGPPSSAYSQGVYHGRITLPPTYPLRPPNFRFVTPNGRFETNREICLSISGHHEETWQPAWGIRTAIVALRSFMETNADGQVGGLSTTDDRRRRLAAESRSFKCAKCSKTNAQLIAECEEAADQASESAREIEIPQELRLAFKDEMESKTEEVKTSSTGSDSETAQLAEGFVQTAPQSAQAAAPPQPTQTQPYPQARPAQGVPQPTGPSAAPVQLQQMQQQMQNMHHMHQQQQESTLEWIDWAIYFVVGSLVLMISKILVS